MRDKTEVITPDMCTQERLAASRAVTQEIRKSQLAHVYQIELTGEEWQVLTQATMLNRRMLDRGAEHSFIDTVLTMVSEKARNSWLSTEEGLLLTNKSRAVWGIEEQITRPVPKTIDD